MAISLVSKMFGSELIGSLQKIQVMFMYHLQWKQEVKNITRFIHHPSLEVGKIQLEQWLKKILNKGKRPITRTKQPVQFNSNSRLNLVNKSLSNFDLIEWVKNLGIRNLQDIFSRDAFGKKDWKRMWNSQSW